MFEQIQERDLFRKVETRAKSERSLQRIIATVIKFESHANKMSLDLAHLLNENLVLMLTHRFCRGGYFCISIKCVTRNKGVVKETFGGHGFQKFKTLERSDGE